MDPWNCKTSLRPPLVSSSKGFENCNCCHWHFLVACSKLLKLSFLLRFASQCHQLLSASKLQFLTLLCLFVGETASRDPTMCKLLSIFMHKECTCFCKTWEMASHLVSQLLLCSMVRVAGLVVFAPPVAQIAGRRGLKLFGLEWPKKPKSLVAQQACCLLALLA
jgi:hypothetical protein